MYRRKILRLNKKHRQIETILLLFTKKSDLLPTFFIFKLFLPPKIKYNDGKALGG